ncbi:hypothetical protein OOK27_40780 [Streptomyces canus]|nr:hypothetical protein [Streptomyces canus]MCX5260413.1 hypothetical protein [Streptomyces canus]
MVTVGGGSRGHRQWQSAYKLLSMHEAGVVFIVHDEDATAATVT